MLTQLYRIIVSQRHYYWDTIISNTGGPDGLRPQHLKDLTCASTGDAGRRLLTLLTQFTNLCLAGRVPAEIQPVFCGASLCALNKKDGGIRPIAVGSTLRRLIAKTACKAVTVKMAERFLPVQLGFGVPRATESAVHAARQYLSKLQPGYGLLKLDFSNAFNSIRRDVMFATVLREMPELYPFVHMCYSNASLLSFGEFLLQSEECAQQGDPLGPPPLLCFYYGSSEKHDVRAEHLVYGWRYNRWTTKWSSSRSRYRTTHRTNTGIAAQWGQVWNCHQRSRCNLQIQSSHAEHSTQLMQWRNTTWCSDRRHFCNRRRPYKQTDRLSTPCQSSYNPRCSWCVVFIKKLLWDA